MDRHFGELESGGWGKWEKFQHEVVFWGRFWWCFGVLVLAFYGLHQWWSWSLMLMQLILFLFSSVYDTYIDWYNINKYIFLSIHTCKWYLYIYIYINIYNWCAEQYWKVHIHLLYAIFFIQHSCAKFLQVFDLLELFRIGGPVGGRPVTWAPRISWKLRSLVYRELQRIMKITVHICKYSILTIIWIIYFLRICILKVRDQYQPKIHSKDFIQWRLLCWQVGWEDSCA